MSTSTARILHVTIECPWREVYRFAADPENMPKWASGLAGGLTRDGDDYLADGGPLGAARVHFTPDNEYGVLDHRVTLPDGTVVDNALRVVPNGDGAEVMFTLLRQPNMTDEQMDADAAHVQRDLETLARLLSA